MEEIWMNKSDFEILMELLRKKSIEKFDELKTKPCGLTEKEMVCFFSGSIHTRKVNDWGRDEDTDYVLGITENGWEKYITVIEVGAGKSVVTDESSKFLENRNILDLLDEINVKQYLAFMARANEVYNK